MGELCCGEVVWLAVFGTCVPQTAQRGGTPDPTSRTSCGQRNDKKREIKPPTHQVESLFRGVSGSQARSQTDFSTLFLYTDPHFAQLDPKQRQLSIPTCYVRGSRCRCSDWLIRTVEYIQPCDGRCSKTHKVTTWTRVPQNIPVKAFVLF